MWNNQNSKAADVPMQYELLQPLRRTVFIFPKLDVSMFYDQQFLLKIQIYYVSKRNVYTCPLTDMD
jgi:hypothetical protein